MVIIFTKDTTSRWMIQYVLIIQNDILIFLVSFKWWCLGLKRLLSEVRGREHMSLKRTHFLPLLSPTWLFFYPALLSFSGSLQTGIFPESWYGVWHCPHPCPTELGQFISNSRLLLGGRLWSRHLFASSEFSLHVRLDTGENQQSTSSSPPYAHHFPHVPLSVHHHVKLRDHLWMLPFDPKREVTPLLQSLQWLSTVFKVREKKQLLYLATQLNWILTVLTSIPTLFSYLFPLYMLTGKRVVQGDTACQGGTRGFSPHVWL